MRLIKAGAVPIGWLTALTELGTDFAGPSGKGMMQIIQAHWPASTVGPTHDTRRMVMACNCPCRIHSAGALGWHLIVLSPEARITRAGTRPCCGLFAV